MIECQTLELVKLNQKIMDAHNEAVNMSDRSVQELIHVVRSEIHPLFKISEGIAMIDMITSFAQLVTTGDYIRPELTDTLAIKAGRHPIREKIQVEKYVPNDVYATQQTRFQIITGCNMSGKSTYIRSIALMNVMAQIGCFVPAQYASFLISHQIFARISTDDNTEGNVSTFAAEMREIALIVRNIERRSLVIIDELGRGTSTTDGLAIAIAIAEAFIESRAYVWFVTHFRDLARILSERAGVVNLHLAVDISVSSSKMKMLYEVADGYEEEKFYGLALARVVDLPEDVIMTATKVSMALHRHNEARKSNAKVLSISRRRKLVLSLREQLILAKNGNMEGEELRRWLKRLQDEFAVRMQAIEAESELALAEHGGTAVLGEDFTSRPSADQEDQAAQFPTDHGKNISPAAEGTLGSFATPQRPINRESQSPFAQSVDEGQWSMADPHKERKPSITESTVESQEF